MIANNLGKDFGCRLKFKWIYFKSKNKCIKLETNVNTNIFFLLMLNIILTILEKRVGIEEGGRKFEICVSRLY